MTTVEDRDDYEKSNPIGTRGGFTKVALSCPFGHRFNLVIANHKGTEIIGVASVDVNDGS